MGGFIRVYSSDNEKIDAALEDLQKIGVEVLTSTTEEASELVLFYLSRMNSKFDNFGQLRHLVTLNKELQKSRQTQETQESYRRQREHAQQRFSWEYFKHKIDSLGDKYTGSKDGSYIENLTMEQIDVIIAMNT